MCFYSPSSWMAEGVAGDPSGYPDGSPLRRLRREPQTTKLAAKPKQAIGAKRAGSPLWVYLEGVTLPHGHFC